MRGPGGVCRAFLASDRPPVPASPYARRVSDRLPSITAIRLPIDWTSLGWPEIPDVGGIVLSTGDPVWSWEPSAPAFPVPVGTGSPGSPVAGFAVDHVVLLVPDLEGAIGTLGRIGTEPRLRMTIRGDRPAAFFRVGTVLEVIEAPVRQASLYGIALTSEGPLESLSLHWRSLGLTVGDITPAVQPGRRIMTVHGFDAGLAVMSSDGAAPRR